ncbi:MAG: sulfite exporter TauE/SafE family protein [Campylobacterota bacterium]|nr:sulfite exporter TauE/SafE family protein [Campylobacterota bacterium]
METVDIISIITIAFLGSFGHCIGMCGGIVIAYSSTKVQQQWSKAQQSIAHILYSLGRVLTYALLGAVFGYLGGVATFSNTANGILWLVAGSAMLLTGLSLLGKIKFLTLIEHSVSKSNWYSQTFKSLLSSQTFLSFFLLGMLNGLLPCGFVYFFAITAASTADPFYGALVMVIFGLSTIPALFSLGFFVGLFKQSGLRGIMIKLAAISVILYGSYTIYNGYDYLVNPDRTILECH